MYTPSEFNIAFEKLPSLLAGAWKGAMNGAGGT